MAAGNDVAGIRWLSIATLFQLCLISACQKGTSSDPTPEPAKPVTKPVVERRVTDDEVVAFCGGCHKMPSADLFPKSAWYDEVKQGFDFYHQFKPKELTQPPFLPVVEYFRSRAPEKLDLTPPETAPPPDRLKFHTQEILLPLPNNSAPAPLAISFMGTLPRPQPPGRELLLSDMASGGVFLVDAKGSLQVTRLGSGFKNPCVVHGCDLNGNGRLDLVVADLGSFIPADHEQGSVIWVPDVMDQRSTQSVIPLLQGVGRVADVQSADFDADGDLDLVVAEFGWHRTGHILLLRNDGNASAPRFTSRIVDPRPGAIHVPVVDLNKDGRPDFVALISQQFEVIEAFLNQGDGSFKKQTIRIADDPSFGSSGIQIVDLDGDGDDDVLYTNGDSFDSLLIKPYHGIQWLENTGQFPFVNHRLTSLPGVHRALAGDIDQDGDLDIVACAFFPSVVQDSPEARKFDSVILLDQQGPGQFVRYRLEKGNCIHPSMELSDFDGDGDLDFAVGSFRIQTTADQPAATIWWNDIPAKR